MRKFENNCFIKLVRNFSLSQEDEMLFSLCYSPFLGVEASNLYHSFYALSGLEFHNNVYSLEDINRISNLSGFSLTKAVMKLEAINLMETYRKEETKKVLYLIKLIPTASPKKFFNDTQLSSLLQTHTNMQYFQKCKNKYVFNEFDNVGYIQMTTDLSEVFDSQELNSSNEEITEQIKETSFVSSKMLNVSREELEGELLNAQVNLNIIKEYEDNILSILNLFKFDFNDKFYIDAIISSITNENCFLMDKFNYLIKTYFKDKELEKIKNSKIKTNSSDSEIKENITAKLFDKLLTLNPFDIIKYNIGEDKIINDELVKVITKLSQTYSFSNQIINLILDYTYRNTNDFPPKYILAIANSVYNKSITDPYKLIDHLYLKDKKIKETNTENSSKKKKSKSNKTQINIDDDFSSVIPANSVDVFSKDNKKEVNEESIEDDDDFIIS